MDDATGYITITLMAGHDAESLWQAYEKGWLLWAGPPDKIISDNERGLISNENVRRISRSGSFYDPAAPYALWQKGKAERSISAAKSVFRKTVSHMQVLGREEMEITGHEVASGLNHHINESGVSASLLLFGQRESSSMARSGIMASLAAIIPRSSSRAARSRGGSTFAMCVDRCPSASTARSWCASLFRHARDQ